MVHPYLKLNLYHVIPYLPIIFDAGRRSPVNVGLYNWFNNKQYLYLAYAISSSNWYLGSNCRFNVGCDLTFCQAFISTAICSIWRVNRFVMSVDSLPSAGNWLVRAFIRAVLEKNNGESWYFAKLKTNKWSYPLNQLFNEQSHLPRGKIYSPNHAYTGILILYF